MMHGNSNIKYKGFTFDIFTLRHVLIHHSFIPSTCAEFDDSLPFSGSSSILLFYVLFPANLLHQLVFHPPSPNLANSFLVYISNLFFPKSYI